MWAKVGGRHGRRAMEGGAIEGGAMVVGHEWGLVGASGSVLYY